MASLTCVALATSIACALGACGSDSETEPPIGADASPIDPGTLQLRGACTLDQRLGGFSIARTAGLSSVSGFVRDGVVPVTILQETASAGDCRLLRRRNPFCDPPCSAGQTCDFDGSCIGFPVTQNVGVVTVDGLVAPVEMSPLPPGNNYQGQVPHPAFEPGDGIRLTTTAGAYGELTLHGVGVHPLELPDGDTWSVERGAPLAVSWTAPTGDVRSTVHAVLSVDQHGTAPLALHCEFADTGSGSIAVELVDAMLDSGVSGFPNGEIVRHTVDSMAVSDGCIELDVASPRAQRVRVVGHTPCTGPGQCPDGQTCDLATETCR